MKPEDLPNRDTQGPRTLEPLEDPFTDVQAEPKIEKEPQKEVSLSDSDWQAVLEGVWLGSDYAADEENCTRLRAVARRLEEKLGK